MDTTHMNYVVKIAEEGNITRASQRLNITQPALSRALVRIEDNLRAKLFDRDGKTMRLTSEGEIVYEWCLDTLKSYQKMLSEIHPDKSGRINPLKIAFSGYMISHDIILDFMKNNPDIIINDCEFKKDDYPKIIDQVDCVISVKEFPYPDVDNIGVYSSPLYLVVPSNHPLADRESVTMKDLEGQHMMISNEDNLFYEQIAEMHQMAGITMLPGSRIDKYHLISMLREGLGVSIVSKAADTLLNDKSDKIVCLPIRDDFCRMHVYLSWKRKPEYSKAFKVFRKYVINYQNR